MLWYRTRGWGHAGGRIHVVKQATPSLGKATRHPDVSTVTSAPAVRRETHRDASARPEPGDAIGVPQLLAQVLRQSSEGSYVVGIGTAVIGFHGAGCAS